MYFENFLRSILPSNQPSSGRLDCKSFSLPAKSIIEPSFSELYSPSPRALMAVDMPFMKVEALIPKVPMLLLTLSSQSINPSTPLSLSSWNSARVVATDIILSRLSLLYITSPLRELMAVDMAVKNVAQLVATHRVKPTNKSFYSLNTILEFC